MIVFRSEQIMLLYTSADICPKILKSVVIDSSLNVYISVNSILLKTIDGITFPSKFNNIPSLLNVLSKVDSLTSGQEKVQNYIQVLSNLISDWKEFIPDRKRGRKKFSFRADFKI